MGSATAFLKPLDSYVLNKDANDHLRGRAEYGGIDIIDRLYNADMKTGEVLKEFDRLTQSTYPILDTVFEVSYMFPPENIEGATQNWQSTLPQSCAPGALARMYQRNGVLVPSGRTKNVRPNNNVTGLSAGGSSRNTPRGAPSTAVLGASVGPPPHL